MAKRKLTKQQQHRIRQNQQKKQSQSRQREEDISDENLGPAQQGLVIAHFGKRIEVEPLEAEHDKPSTVFCHFRANITSLVAGDLVTWREGTDGTGVIVARQDRQTELSRPDPYGKLKVVAANVNQVFIVCSVLPEPTAIFIDRYLVAAEHLGLTPVIVLNKIELLDDSNRETVTHLMRIYQALGYDVIEVSALETLGLSPLFEKLRNHCSIFVGPSGVGKSSLINALLPVEAKVGNISEANARGKHTTTTATLYHIPEGGDLLDSPGIREFGLWHMEDEDIMAAFIEFRPALGMCKFRNCTHEKEPGCAIRELIEAGDICPERLQSYQRILIANQEMRS